MSSETISHVEVDSVDFAIYLYNKAINKNLTINVTKIQKWLYICYGVYFAAHSKQLLSERPQAWKHGPVFPNVHSKQINNNNSLKGLAMSKNENELMKYDFIINAVLVHFGTWSAQGLVTWTTSADDGRAWSIKYHNDGAFAPMDNDDIKNDFKRYIS